MSIPLAHVVIFITLAIVCIAPAALVVFAAMRSSQISQGEQTIGGKRQ